MNKTDATATIAELSKFMHEFRASRKWESFDDPYDLAAALSVEAAEILELLLWQKNVDVKKLITEEPELKQKLAEEIADTFSYLLILARSLNLDLTESFFMKMEKNKARFPEKKGDVSLPKRWKDR